MPAANSAHTRHCSCIHVPEERARLTDWLHTLFPALTQGEMERGVDTLLGRSDAPSDRRHSRTLDAVSLPDDWGHQYWEGRVTRGQPTVMLDGKTITVAEFLWVRAGGMPGIPLARTCHVAHCISPQHHALATPEVEQKLRERDLQHASLAEFDRANPKVNPRPKRWGNGPHGEVCLRGDNHRFKVYGDPRLRNSYCQDCAAYERDRRARRQERVNAVQRALDMLSTAQVEYVPRDIELDMDDALPADMTLEDQIQEMLARPEGYPADPEVDTDM